MKIEQRQISGPSLLRAEELLRIIEEININLASDARLSAVLATPGRLSALAESHGFEISKEEEDWLRNAGELEIPDELLGQISGGGDIMGFGAMANQAVAGLLDPKTWGEFFQKNAPQPVRGVKRDYYAIRSVMHRVAHSITGNAAHASAADWWHAMRETT